MKKRIILVVLVIIAVWIAIAAVASHRLVVAQYVVPSNKVSEEVKVVQLSDLHFHEFGAGNIELVDTVRKCAPDIIVITGDLFDIQGDSVPKQLVQQLVGIAPVYYAPGNHEFDINGEYEQNYLPFLASTGVHVLDNTSTLVSVNAQKIQLSGLYSTASLAYENEYFRTGLEQLKADQEQQYFQLLLAHMPDYFAMYMEYDYDLVLSGHTHGGHMRIPFTQIGAYAAGPQHTLLPKYVYGEYRSGDKRMIVSAGLGGGSKLQNAIPRFGNPYEVVEIVITPVNE
ncbi:metallophosphoesterase [Culicoidibacter larvae]|uniref:Metallophosphoesterase n=1 Tax=Culicoidibacter larvae TaxID=2579976 RepID=A0A5R8QEQ0_9FIRM|nr:metallophosphoesterase [Culicoidibacter larvae]TLG75422.1 metallophosphoesterase [Culicoidibacter larvae]